MPSTVFSANTGDVSGLINTVLDSFSPDDTGDAAAEGRTTFDGSARRISMGVGLSGLGPITAGATINSVTIELYRNGGYTPSVHPVDAHRILPAWVLAQMTWNSRSSGNAWTSAGAQGSGTDIAATASGSANVADLTEYFQFTGAGLAADVQAFLDGGISQLMWALLASTATGELFPRWDMSAGPDGQRPRIVVDWTEGGGGTSYIPAYLQMLRSNQ